MKVRFTLEDEPVPKPSYTNRPVTFITGFWNFIAIFLVVPSTFQWNSSTNKFSLSTSLFQKIICGIAHFSVIITTLLWLGIRIANLSKMDYTDSKIVDIFHLIKSSSSGLKSLFFIKILWTRKMPLIDFVNLNWSHFKATTSQWKVLLLIGYMVLTCVTYWGIGNLDKFMNEFMSLMSISSYASVTEESARWWLTPFHVFIQFSSFASSTTLSATNFIFLSIVLTLHSIAQKFEILLKCQQIHSSNLIEMGLSKYSQLKCTVTSANHFMGDLVFAIYLETLLYFAETTAIITANPHYQQTLMFSLYLGLFVYVWFLACEFYRKVNDATIEWIANCQADLNISMDQRLRLNALSNENRDAPLGISCRFFTVTYSVIGSMLGLIVTYGIIVLQVRTNKSD